MSKELAFILINPYTIAKSRTGGVLARALSRTDLDFVAARMFAPGRELCEKYADYVRSEDPNHKEMCGLIADYILKNYTPDAATGKRRRVMMLLFEGEDAIKKIVRTAGDVKLKSDSGETIRDTYGDYIVDAGNNVQYFEPAVLIPPTREHAVQALKLWARYSASDGGLIGGALDVPEGDSVERTLVLLKPDNFRVRSLRPGNIIDILSASGLRIIGIKKFCMTVSQAEEFYGPVKESLASKFKDFGPSRVGKALSAELDFEIPRTLSEAICVKLGPLFAKSQFESIVHFMTGYMPSDCKDSEKPHLGSEGCVALAYQGPEAVTKIRDILGPTDPSKASPGSVRREFGSNIMVNAAHASDSRANAAREMAIIRIEEDTIKPLVDRHYGGVMGRISALGRREPHARRAVARRAKRKAGKEY